VNSSPAIGADGTVYVGSFDGRLYAINPDGTQKWASSRVGSDFSSPAIGVDGTVYVGSVGGRLYAFNLDGTQKWAFLTGAPVQSSPAIGGDGTIYVGSNNGHVYAIHPDGTQKWAFLTEGNVFSSPAIGGDGTIYVGSDDRNVYAISSDGGQRWVFPTGLFVQSSPAIGVDSTIYVGSDDGHLYAINPDGTQKWAFVVQGGVPSSPAIGADGTIYVGWESDRAGLVAINPDGTQKWVFALGDVVFSSPAIGQDGTVYVGSGLNELHAINGSSGGLSNSPWPMFHRDLKHTGRAPTTLLVATVLVANFVNGNNDTFNSRVYLFNPSQSAGNVTVRVFTLPVSGGTAQELTGTPLNLGTLEARSALNLKLVEDILMPLGITTPYTDNGGNLTLEFTIYASNVRGTAQVFSSDFAFGTYPLQAIPAMSAGSPTVLVVNFTNGNDDAFNSRVYLWNPSESAGNVTVRVFTLPIVGGLAQELTTAPLDLGTLDGKSAVNIKVVEDILTLLGITPPYTTDGGNLTLEFTIEAPDVVGAAQVFSSDFAFGTYPLQSIQ
jgi:outer membrane protein assembly factor BamB